MVKGILRIHEDMEAKGSTGCRLQAGWNGKSLVHCNSVATSIVVGKTKWSLEEIRCELNQYVDVYVVTMVQPVAAATAATDGT